MATVRSAEEPETNISVPQQEEHRDAREGDIIADYDLDIYYEPEGSQPEIKPVNEEEENLMQNMQKWSYLESGS